MGAYGADGVGDNDDDDCVGIMMNNDEHADVDVDNKGVNGDGDRGKMVLMIVTASDIPRLTSSSPLDSVKREGVRGVSTIM